MGHGWLSENPDRMNLFPNFNFKNLKNIKIIFLNKEYSILEKKLNFIKENNFSFALTHNQDFKKYQNYTGIDFFFLPFAINANLENLYVEKKDIDVFFSGIYQNRNIKNIQELTRIKMMKKFYFSLGAFKIFKKKLYRNKKIFINGFTSNDFQNRLLKKLKMYTYLEKDKYFNYLSKSKITLCSLSPSDLIGNRFFEAMALKSLVLCESSEKYDVLFKPYHHYIPYSLDLSDFDEKISFGLSDSNEVKKIVNQAQENIFNNHTWDHRVEHLKKILKQYVSKKNI